MRLAIGLSLVIVLSLTTGLTLVTALITPLSAQGQAKQAVSTGAHPEIAAAAQTITAEDMYARIAFLASDELRGRNTPSPGLERAAEYIAQHFRELGLEPAGDVGGYVQRYPYRQQSVDATGEVGVGIRAEQLFRHRRHRAPKLVRQQDQGPHQDEARRSRP